jgi:hypothetical protein
MNDACGIDFPIINNIPILINEADSIFNIKDYVNMSYASSNVSLKRKVKKLVERIMSFTPSLSNNLSAKNDFKLLEELLSQKINPKILIIGGGIITTNTEMIFNAKNTVIESDVYIGPRTQIVIDGHHIPFENNTFDLVIYQGFRTCRRPLPMCARSASRFK